MNRRSTSERIDADERAGDLGSARLRLESRAASTGYDAETCERIARISVRMQDPVEAGRWYFLCESSDPASQPCIDKFLARHGSRPQAILSALPRALVRAVGNGKGPAIARQRVDELAARLDVPAKFPKAEPTKKIGCVLDIVIVIAVLVCFVVGLITIIQWVN